jgi:hypothetical protein
MGPRRSALDLPHPARWGRRASPGRAPAGYPQLPGTSGQRQGHAVHLSPMGPVTSESIRQRLRLSARGVTTFAPAARRRPVGPRRPPGHRRPGPPPARPRPTELRRPPTPTPPSVGLSPWTRRPHPTREAQPAPTSDRASHLHTEPDAVRSRPEQCARTVAGWHGDGCNGTERLPPPGAVRGPFMRAGGEDALRRRGVTHA